MICYEIYVLCHRYPDPFHGDPSGPSVMPYPTSKRESARWLDELSSIVNQSSKRQNNTSFSGSWQSNEDFTIDKDTLESHTRPHPPVPIKPPGLEDRKSLFTSLKNFPHLRRSLPSLNSARSQLYSSSYFGNTKWYSEGFDFREKALSIPERRKFRFCLKSNVDFLIQLDIQI